MAKSLGTLFRRRRGPGAPAAPTTGPAAAGPVPAGPAPGAPSAAAAVPANINPHFAPAFFTTAERGRPMLVLFSQADRLVLGVRREVRRAQPAPLRRLRGRSSTCTSSPSANHVLTFESWQAEMLEHLRRWLDARFAPRMINVLHLRDTDRICGPGKTIIETACATDTREFSQKIGLFKVAGEPPTSTTRRRGVAASRSFRSARRIPTIRGSCRRCSTSSSGTTSTSCTRTSTSPIS